MSIDIDEINQIFFDQEGVMHPLTELTYLYTYGAQQKQTAQAAQAAAAAAVVPDDRLEISKKYNAARTFVGDKQPPIGLNTAEPRVSGGKSVPSIPVFSLARHKDILGKGEATKKASEKAFQATMRLQEKLNAKETKALAKQQKEAEKSVARRKTYAASTLKKNL